MAASGSRAASLDMTGSTPAASTRGAALRAANAGGREEPILRRRGVPRGSAPLDGAIIQLTRCASAGGGSGSVPAAPVIAAAPSPSWHVSEPLRWRPDGRIMHEASCPCKATTPRRPAPCCTPQIILATRLRDLFPPTRQGTARGTPRRTGAAGERACGRSRSASGPGAPGVFHRND